MMLDKKYICNEINYLVVRKSIYKQKIHKIMLPVFRKYVNIIILKVLRRNLNYFHFFFETLFFLHLKLI